MNFGTFIAVAVAVIIIINGGGSLVHKKLLKLFFTLFGAATVFSLLLVHECAGPELEQRHQRTFFGL